MPEASWDIAYSSSRNMHIISLLENFQRAKYCTQREKELESKPALPLPHNLQIKSVSLGDKSIFSVESNSEHLSIGYKNKCPCSSTYGPPIHSPSLNPVESESVASSLLL